jgi:hypothetical protein
MDVNIEGDMHMLIVVCVVSVILIYLITRFVFQPTSLVKKIGESKYELYPFEYTFVKSSELNLSGIRLESKYVWVDRAEIPNFLEENGCDIISCNWERIIFTVDGDRVEFINGIAQRLSRVAESLRREI